MNITQENLDQVFEKYHGLYGGIKNDYFGLIYLSKKFNKAIEDVAYEVAFGSHDYGIDGFHIDKESKVLYLFQFKWSENHLLFKDSYKRLIESGFERIFGNPLQDIRQNSIIPKLKQGLLENRSIIENVLIYFVFNGNENLAEKSAILETLREDLETKSYLIKQFFDERPIIIAPIYESNNTNRVSEIVYNRTIYSYEIPMEIGISKVATNGASLNIGLINLMDLHNIYKEMGHKLFDRNIRFGLSIDNSPNRSIKKSLENIVLKGNESSEDFTFNHNGITLYVENLKILDGAIKIIEPRILNGAQTITTLSRFVELNKDNRTFKDNLHILNSIQIIAKIISNASKSFIVNVTICNNKQNPVKPWNLRANDEVQLEFQDKFANEPNNGIYYERQENAFESLQDSELDDLGVTEKYKKIELIKLAQTFLALQGEVEKISSYSDVFESESMYSNTFKKSYLQANVKMIIMLYKVQKGVGGVIRELHNINYNNYWFYSKAKNLIWCLLIQGILNDKKIDKNTENYGNSLIYDSEFAQKLKKLGTNEIRILIKEVINSHYNEQIESQKFSFFKSKAIYQKCMDLAFDKYGWTKQTI